MAQSQPDFALSSEQRAEFEARGVLRLPGLLSARAVQRARDVVLARLAELGLWRDGAWRLDAAPRPQWPASGLKTSKVIGNRRPELEALVEEPGLAAAVDALLDGEPCDREVFRRPQLLFTLPNIDTWVLPTGWHADGPRLAGGGSPGAQLFACLDHVGPRGGGTAVIAGSHRLLNDRGFLRTSDITQALRGEPFFRELFAGRVSAEGGLPKGRIGDVPVEVIEATGAPGDAYLLDLRTLHASAPNASDRPRMMVTHRFMRVSAVREMAAGFGWSGAAEPGG